jgi:hypothetical protein
MMSDGSGEEPVHHESKFRRKIEKAERLLGSKRLIGHDEFIVDTDKTAWRLMWASLFGKARF